MKAANFRDPGLIEFHDDATPPQPAPGEVIVAVKACGICGSDLHMYRDNSYRDQLVRKTPEGYEVPGHEFAGVISEIGDGVTGWSIGQRVVGVTGQGGGMADAVAVPANPFQLVAMPDSVDFDIASTTEPLADGLQMVTKAKICDGENVVVFGVGIIGLGVVQAILARGVKPDRIIAIDVHQARLDKALEVGATHAINARDNDVFDAIAAICGTEANHAGTSARIGVVIDCAGYIKHMKGPPPLETALRLIDLHGGRIVCFGGFEGKMTIDMGPIIQKQPVIMGSNGYAAEELVEALDLMARNIVDRRTLISHRIPLSEIAQAFKTQDSPEAIKVLLEI